MEELFKNSADESGKSKNWLVAFWFLVFCSVPFLIFLQLAIAMSGSVNPLIWNKQITFFIFYFFAMLAVSIASYLEQAGKVKKMFHVMESLTDMSEYKDKKPLDVFFSHYTNVATVGLLWGLSIYTYRSFQSDQPIIQLLLIFAFVIANVVIIGFYTLFLFKLAERLVHLKSVIFYIGMVIAVFFVDAKAFEMIIKSVPLVKLHANADKQHP